MSRSVVVLFSCLAMLATAQFAQAGLATYDDFNAYVIRPGTNGSYTTGVTWNDAAQTFNVTAVGGGKVVLATSAINGVKVSDFLNLKFSNSATPTNDTRMVYMSFWVTDGDPNHYALISVGRFNGIHVDDFAQYPAMTSAGGMDATFFQGLSVRAYGTDLSNLDWLYPGAQSGTRAPASGWQESLWKPAAPGVNNPVLISDLNSNLVFGSPFTTTTLPSLNKTNPEWLAAKSGDPQMPESFYLMCGDTSGGVQNFDYTLGNIELQWASATAVPEPSSLALCGVSALGMVGLGLSRRVRRQRTAA